MQQRKYSAGSLLACGLAVWCCLLPAAVPAQAQNEHLISIGFAGKLTDVLVQSAQNGAEIAIDEANQQGAKMHEANRFMLLAQNDHDNPNLTAFVANYFINAKVSGVIGHWSTDATLAVAQAYEKAGIAQVNFTTTNSKVTRLGYQTTFRTVGSTADLAHALANAALDVLHGQRIAIIGNDSSYSQALSREFAGELAARAMPVQQRSLISARSSDFNTALQSAIDAQVDVIIFSGYLMQSADFMKAARRLGVKANILLNYGASNYPLRDADSSNLYTLEPDMSQTQRPDWKNFEEQYRARYGHAPSTYSRQAFNATAMLIKAIRQAGSAEAAKVTQALHQTRYAGLGCEIAFDAVGNNSHPAYTLYHAEQQRWKVIRFLPESNCGSPH